MNPYLVSPGNPTGCEWVHSGVPCPNGCAPDPTIGQSWEARLIAAQPPEPPETEEK